MSPIRRFVPLLIAGAAFIAAACSDAVAPTRSATARALPTPSAFGGGPASYSSFVNEVAESNAKTVTFTLDPQGGRVKVGGYWIVYPANVVCDPSQTGYGPSEWKNPCVTLDVPITITAKYWQEDGRQHTDFSPDIRFDPSKTVVMSTKVKSLIGQDVSDSVTGAFSIWYSTRVGDVRYFIDDAAEDPDVATSFDIDVSNGKANGKVSRRIYHFSGYFVREGIWCEDGDLFPDPECLIPPP